MGILINKSVSKALSTGFTLVELLIVIVVIAILAAIAINTYSGVQDQARYSQALSDIKTLEKAIYAARINNSQLLSVITGSTWTHGGCDGEAVPNKNLPLTNDCWVDYHDALDAIAAASGSNLDEIRDGDPWGNVYRIDENETATICNRDGISTSGRDLMHFAGDDDEGTVIRNYRADC